MVVRFWHRNGEHKVRRRIGTIVGFLVMCGLLSACSSTGGHYAFDVRNEDMVGTWVATGDLGTRLELASDGTLSASAWPRNVMCSGKEAEFTSELAGAPTVDFTGRWRFDKGDEELYLAFIRLYVDGGVCPDGTPQGYLWEGTDNRVSICIPLGNPDPDNFQFDRTLVLQKDSNADQGGAKPCV